MSRLRFVGICCGLVTLLGVAASAEEQDAKGVAFFEAKIRPVLVQQCYKCHSAESSKVKGGLLLDTRDGVRKGGETGHAVVPGNVDESLILSALRHEDFEMPPGKKLADGVVADFEAWIKMGAPDPREGQAVAGGKRVIDIEEGRNFWAFQPPKKADPPKVKNAAWAKSEIDRFVLAELEARGLKPAREANPTELIRRITFDLTGLPPTPAEVEAFTKACETDREGATKALIDRLLDSPQFGERWGRHWLDVARYADSNGNADNTPFPQAWRYRNYVIDALNADKPYDQFITEQIAGDVLPFDNARQRNQQLIATGFLALGSKPRAQNNPNYQMDVVADQIEVTTSAVIGLTVACARCHDHKFDPIPTAEYYSLAGIFTSTRTLYGSGGRGGGKGQPAGRLVSLLAEDDKSSQEQQDNEKQRATLTDRQREISAQLAKLGAADDKAKGGNAKQAAQIKKLQALLAKLQDKGDNSSQIDKIKAQLKRLGADPDASESKKDATEKDKRQIKSLQDELAKVESELKSLQAQAPQPAGEAMGVEEGSPADCAICIAGESTDRGDVVPRGFVSVATIGDAPTIDSKSSGRLELAEWLTSPENPLTARVMANRIWHHLFGRGIVRSVDNLGQLGERPSHTELLDWLAVQFVQDGWSVKRMIRTIMLSRAYQMSSDHDDANYKTDPDNDWLWRMRPRRLGAEQLRDAILAFSGRLDLERPGAGDLPEYNRKQPPQVRADGNHRSVYLPIIRNGEPEALTLFDFADPSIVVGAREETTVPAQSLYLMNSPFVVNQSEAAAKRIVLQDGVNMSDEERVDYAFLLAFAHLPTDEQRERALGFIQQLTESLGESDAKQQRGDLAAWSTFCQSLIASAEFRYLD